MLLLSVCLALENRWKFGSTFWKIPAVLSVSQLKKKHQKLINFLNFVTPQSNGPVNEDAYYVIQIYRKYKAIWRACSVLCSALSCSVLFSALSFSVLCSALSSSDQLRLAKLELNVSAVEVYVRACGSVNLPLLILSWPAHPQEQCHVSAPWGRASNTTLYNV